MLTGPKHWFTRFLRRHRRLRHFGRHTLLVSIAIRGPARAAPVALAGELLRAAQGEPAAAIALLGSHADGPSAAEAADLLTRSGPNEVEHERPLPPEFDS